MRIVSHGSRHATIRCAFRSVTGTYTGHSADLRIGNSALTASVDPELVLPSRSGHPSHQGAAFQRPSSSPGHGLCGRSARATGWALYLLCVTPYAVAQTTGSRLQQHPALGRAARCAAPPAAHAAPSPPSLPSNARMLNAAILGEWPRSASVARIGPTQAGHPETHGQSDTRAFARTTTSVRRS